MAREVTLLTDQVTFDRLYALADLKKNVVSIPREELLHLLMDYSTMLAALEGSTTFKIEQAAKGHRPRPRLAK